FTKHSLANDCFETLHLQARSDNVDIMAYCFMSDHVHLLAQVQGKTGITRFVQQFKGRSTRIGWAHGIHGTLWQRSFHDHVLRESEPPLAYVKYILQNPVRRNLCKSWW